MARHSVKSDAVQDLVREVLIPLYLTAGSVTAVTKAMNDALNPGGARVLHVNRVQAMLSDDVSRGVNDLTVDATRRAAEAMAAAGWARSPGAEAARLAALAESAAPLLLQDGVEIEDAARTLQVPLAVMKAALAATGRAETFTSTAKPASRSTLVPSTPPDWSYQDTAVARCLDAFARRPTGNIGLVLPTGAGKTRTAFRIILETLARADSDTSRVVWITHRHTLRSQADRELRKLLATAPGSLPPNALQLAKRVRFAMVSESGAILEDGSETPELVVIDEAHHAAAPSYRPIFEAIQAFPVLLLTATPIRTDKLPIFIDEIAFTITYRELADRGAILRPRFDTIGVDSFNWTDRDVSNLADQLVNETADRFTKTLVLANRVDQLVRFYDAFQARLEDEPDHPIQPDDVGFIHGEGNSHGLDNDAFIELFASKPRGVLISAQMLLEGFDDPLIDAVVITYETNSVIKLMQAAGRCVRYAPGKTRAYVLQADNPDLAYRFDQRWLYQEIDDYLRPELSDEDFAHTADLRDRVAATLDAHRVPAGQRGSIQRAVAGLPDGAAPRLLLYGHPFIGQKERFANEAQWGAFVETPENSEVFRGIFNGFSLLGAKLSDPTEYLDAVGPGFGLERDSRPGSLWRQLVEVLTAAYWAREELYDTPGPAQSGRPGSRLGTSTWLKYMVFHHRPALPPDLDAFLADCHNRGPVSNAYMADPDRFAAVMKSDLPLGGAEALLLDGAQASAVTAWLDGMRHDLKLDPAMQLTNYARLTAERALPPLPLAHSSRLDRLLSDAGRERHLLSLTNARKDAE